MLTVLATALIVLEASGQGAEYPTIKSSSVANACSGYNTKVPSAYTMAHMSALSYFKTDNFPVSEYANSDISLCKPDCQPNCCTSPECQEALNANYDKIQPNTVYYLVHGGYLPSAASNRSFEVSDRFVKEVMDQIVQDFHYVSSIDGSIFYLKAENSFPLAFHQGIVIEKKQAGYTSHNYYFFGGVGPRCVLEPNDCRTMWRLSLPTLPIKLGSAYPQLSKLGPPNQHLQSLVGHCLAFDAKANQIIVYGGMLLKGENSTYSSSLWSFHLESYAWAKVAAQEFRNVTLSADNKTIEFSQYNVRPQPRLFPSCLIDNDSLIVIGGLTKTAENEDVYLHDIWSFNFTTSLWTAVRKEYFYYDIEMAFDHKFFPSLSQSLSLNTNSYRIFELMSDFSQTAKRLKGGMVGTFSIMLNIPLCHYSYKDESFFCSTKPDTGNACGQDHVAFYQKTGARLKTPCYANGDCVQAACQCKAGYFGADCRYRECPSSCGISQNSTYFTAFQDHPSPDFRDDKSTCIYTYPESYCSCSQVNMAAGEDCSKLLCLNDCSLNGVCNFATGVCTCSSAYTGEDCSLINILLDA